MNNKQRLEQEISSWKLIDATDSLTEQGKGYLQGLERAYALLGAAE